VPILKTVKDCVVHWPAALQMLDYDSLEQFRSHSGVPHAIGVNDNDRTVAAHTETRSFSAFHSMRTKQKTFSIQKLSENGIELAPARVRRAKAARAYKDMPRVGLHPRLRTINHERKISDTQIPLAHTDSAADYP
jgi:hypothetical protein